jgi:hypothetical protein
MQAAVSHRVTINLFVPGKMLSKAIANPSDPCGVLQKLFHNQKMPFVYNGMRIDDNCSFEFYGIQTSETLVALSENSDPVRQVARWIQTSRDSETFDSLINSMMNASTRGESMRLRDISMLKKEMDRRRGLRCVTSAEKMIHRRVHRDITQVTEKAEAISTEPLPVPWSSPPE